VRISIWWGISSGLCSNLDFLVAVSVTGVQRQASRLAASALSSDRFAAKFGTTQSITDTLVLCGPQFPVELFNKPSGGNVAKTRVTPLAVIKNFDVFPNRHPSLCTRCVTLAMNQFVFQAAQTLSVGALS
jgi:hypothetical protein